MDHVSHVLVSAVSNIIVVAPVCVYLLTSSGLYNAKVPYERTALALFHDLPLPLPISGSV